MGRAPRDNNGNYNTHSLSQPAMPNPLAKMEFQSQMVMKTRGTYRYYSASARCELNIETRWPCETMPRKEEKCVCFISIYFLTRALVYTYIKRQFIY